MARSCVARRFGSVDFMRAGRRRLELRGEFAERRLARAHGGRRARQAAEAENKGQPPRRTPSVRSRGRFLQGDRICELDRRGPRLAREKRPTDRPAGSARVGFARSEEHTSELQSLAYLVCRLLLEKKKVLCSALIEFVEVASLGLVLYTIANFCY